MSSRTTSNPRHGLGLEDTTGVGEVNRHPERSMLEETRWDERRERELGDRVEEDGQEWRGLRTKERRDGSCPAVAIARSMRLDSDRDNFGLAGWSQKNDQKAPHRWQTPSERSGGGEKGENGEGNAVAFQGGGEKRERSRAEEN